MSTFSLAISFAVGLLTWRIIAFYSRLKAVDYLPGIRCAFSVFSPYGVIFGLGLDFPWYRRYSLYSQYGAEAISIVPYISGYPVIFTSSIDIVRQFVSGGAKSNFIKPPRQLEGLRLYGESLITVPGGDGWRKHRRIMGPAFNNDTYVSVWQESIRTFREMTKCEGWDTRTSVTIPSIQRYTFKFALFIIATCGFGLSFLWDEPPSGADGQMTIQEAIGIISATVTIRLAAPRWLYPFSKRLQNIDKAIDILGAFMRNQVDKRKAEILSAQGGDTGRKDTFSLLVQASEMEGKMGLQDDELVGNTFGLMFAGHETTAHSLAATLGLLASHQNEQDIIYNQIKAVLGNTIGDPTFEDYAALDKVSAAFHEAVRMFPSGSLMIREATEDVILDVPTDKGIRKTPLPKGGIIVADVVGLQYNPRQFPDPEKFQPSRWYSTLTTVAADETNNTTIGPDNFTAFSVGPRACLGRKFATVEAVAFLTMLLRDWKVDPLFKDEKETREEWKERVLQGKLVLTMGVLDMPVKLTRRC